MRLCKLVYGRCSYEFNIGRSSNWLGNMPDKHAIRDHAPASQLCKLARPLWYSVLDVIYLYTVQLIQSLHSPEDYIVEYENGLWV